MYNSDNWIELAARMKEEADMGNNTHRGTCGGVRPPDETARLAEKITTELMRNGSGQRARRLQLRGPNEEDFGGRCRKSVQDTIERILSEATDEPVE